MRLVVIGYGPGGVSAALTAKKFAPDTDVIILTRDKLPAHRKPGVTLAFQSPNLQNLGIPDWSPEALKKRGVTVRQGVEVIGGDPNARELTVRTEKGTTEKVGYDKLVIATGGTPAVPAIEGTDLDGVFTIGDISDALRVGERLEEISSVAVVGAGFSGLEAAERLLSMGKEVHLVVRSRLLRRLLESELSAELLQRFPSSLMVHTGVSPERVLGSDTVDGLSLGAQTIKVQAVLFMTGVKPNTQLASLMGLRIGPLGGISVNERMETSAIDVYAVGDCVEMPDFLTGKPVLMPVGSVAARAGRQAGLLAAGGSKMYSDVSLRFQYDRIFGTEIVCMGESTTLAQSLGVRAHVTFTEDPAEFTRTAIVTDESGRVIGGQVLSSRMAAPVGLQILRRMLDGLRLDETPLLKPPHEELKSLLEETLGPLNP
ncbi:MAG: NAD(P)/FAD-dependent oxidoreductase [Candidatus Thorarchaeota archaeon]